MISFNRRQAMKRRRRDNEASNEASSSASSSEVDEAVDEIDSDSSILHEEDDVAQVEEVTEVQLVSNAVDQLETMKRKTLQKENDQLQKEKDGLKTIYDELKSSVGFMEENFKDDDKKVKYIYYTGLPSYSVLIALFDYMSKDL